MSIESAVSANEARTRDLVAANAEFMRFVTTCTTAEWAMVCAEEGWTVGVVAFHVARGHNVVQGWVDSLSHGRAVEMTPEELDASNAMMAAQAVGVTREEVAALAGKNMDALAAFLFALTEEELGTSAPFGPGGGDVASAERLAGSRGHLDHHLASIHAAIGR